MSTRRFYLPPEMAATPAPRISGSDAAHIHRVLRLSPGDWVELFDGAGGGYRARILSVSAGTVTLSIEETFPLMTEPPVHIALAMGMLKDRKMEDLIPPLTELGINRLIPFYAARSVPAAKGSGPSAARLARWKKIAVESVKQCGRGCLPCITPMNDLDAVLAASAEWDRKLIFWEAAAAGNRFTVPEGPPPKRILVVVGPEGGFDPAEITQAQDHGCRVVSLGPRILKTQTAAIAACVLIQHRFGDLG